LVPGTIHSFIHSKGSSKRRESTQIIKWPREF
jgi:hypothetical protein